MIHFDPGRLNSKIILSLKRLIGSGEDFFFWYGKSSEFAFEDV